MRDSNIFSWMSTTPSACVAATRAMLVRSAGNPGHGASSIFGIWPPMVGTDLQALRRRDTDGFPRGLPGDTELGEGDLCHAEVAGGRFIDLDLPPRGRGQTDERAHLHVVAADAKFRSAELFHALDGEDVAPDALDARAHCHEHPTEILDMRLRGGVLDHRGPFRKHGSHDRVLGGSHGCLVEEQSRAFELVGRKHIKGARLDPRAKLLESEKVRVQGASSDAVAAR